MIGVGAVEGTEGENKRRLRWRDEVYARATRQIVKSERKARYNVGKTIITRTHA